MQSRPKKIMNWIHCAGSRQKSRTSFNTSAAAGGDQGRIKPATRSSNPRRLARWRFALRLAALETLGARTQGDRPVLPKKKRPTTSNSDEQQAHERRGGEQEEKEDRPDGSALR